MSLKREKIYQQRLSMQNMHPHGRAEWLQRQNSLSSQSAIYPPSLRQGNGPILRSSHGNQFGTYRSPPSFQSQRPSIVAVTPSSSLASRYPNPFSSSSRAYSHASGISHSSSSSSKKSPLSTMHRASQPEVPVIPDRFLNLKRRSDFSRRPSLPDTWSPVLTHLPLSADPAIRAFSVPIEPEDMPTAQTATFPQGRLSKLDFGEGALELNPNVLVMPPPTVSPPALPERLRGHTINPSLSKNSIFDTFDSPTRIQPPAAQQKPIRISPAPKYSLIPPPQKSSIKQIPESPSLQIRRTRTRSRATVDLDDKTPLIDRPRRRKQGNQTLQVVKSGSSNDLSCNHTRTQSSTTRSRSMASSVYSQTSHEAYEEGLKDRVPTSSQATPEAEKMKKRFERARSQEAIDFGMGGWTESSRSSSRVAMQALENETRQKVRDDTTRPAVVKQHKWMDIGKKKFLF